MSNAQTSGAARAKTVEMALDRVARGTDQDETWTQKSRAHKIPEGITSKMLYQDIIRIAWPSFIEFTLVQLASMVDLMMVGNLGPLHSTPFFDVHPIYVPQCGCHCPGGPV